MEFCIEFSGENPEAVGQELEALLSICSTDKVLFVNDKGALIEGDLTRYTNMAFASRISEIIYSFSDLTALHGFSVPNGKYYIRKVVLATPGENYQERDFGDALNSSGRISFEDPDFVLLAIHAEKWFLGIVRYQRDAKGFEKRKAPMRPFFSPVSLHPKYARFMINLTRTIAGDSIMDPFCGTGGILIEAGLMGRNVIGNDSSLEMVKGARLNLRYYKIPGRIYNLDIEHLSIEEKVDAIATDLPYGRSSPITGDRTSLYSKTFRKFAEILHPRQYCVVIIDNMDNLERISGFSVKSAVQSMVHRSLTRNYIVLMRE